MAVLDLPTENGVVEIEVELDEGRRRLVLLCYIRDARDGWEEKKALHREHLRIVYERIRETCPDLAPWGSMIERSVSPHVEIGWAGAVFLLWLIASAIIGVWMAIRLSFRAGRLGENPMGASKGGA